MTDLDKPYVFRFTEDPGDELSKLLGHEPPMRPAVGIRLVSAAGETPLVVALVDSGSERALAAPWMGRALGLDLENAPSGRLGIGGEDREARFAEVHIELYRSYLTHEQEPIAEWDIEVGFLTQWTPAWSMVLGQRGFFSQFTVTMHRQALAMALEPWDAFDERFGVAYETADDTQPRFRI